MATILGCFIVFGRQAKRDGVEGLRVLDETGNGGSTSLVDKACRRQKVLP